MRIEEIKKWNASTKFKNYAEDKRQSFIQFFYQSENLKCRKLGNFKLLLGKKMLKQRTRRQQIYGTVIRNDKHDYNKQKMQCTRNFSTRIY